MIQNGTNVVKRTVKSKGQNQIMWTCMDWGGVRYAIEIDRRTDGDLFIATLNSPTQIMSQSIFALVSLEGSLPEALRSSDVQVLQV